MRDTTLVVDGYNVIREASGPYAELFDVDVEAARARLIVDVATFAHGEMRATVVFDGGGNARSSGSRGVVAGVEVVFTAHGVEADTVVERTVMEARARGERVVVVTSDAQTQRSVARDEVVRMSARGFIEELRAVRGKVDEANPSRPFRATLSERVGADVAERLERWARDRK